MLPLNARKDIFFLVVILAIAAVYAINNQFIQDDAFISFRYGKNFAEGYGLVWYPGSTEFGYTSFLFTFLTGVLMKFGINVPLAAYALSFPAFLGALAGTYFLGKQLFKNSWAPLLSTFALATHLTFTSYATGGLETSLQTFFIIWTYYFGIVWIKSPNVSKSALLGACATLALLTRLDSALLLLPLYMLVALHELKEFRKRIGFALAAINNLLMVIAMPLVGVLALLYGCYTYYGYALPNTFYVKVDNVWHTDTGITYLYNYVRSQGYIPLLLILYCGWELKSRKALLQYQLLLLSPVIIWLLYILYIGGDFMEYRLLVPVLPFYFLLAFGFILGNTTHLKLFALFASIIVSAFIHKTYYGDSIDSPNNFEVVAFKQLQTPMTEQPNNWLSVGKKLNELFYSGSPDDVKIATTAAGALPYYSALPTIDQLGINTRADKEWKIKFLDYPAHRQRLRDKFLIKENVNLVLDHPLYHYRKPLKCQNRPRLSFHTPVRGAPMVFIPVNQGYYLLAYYLTKHPKIEYYLENKVILPCGK